MAHVTLVKTPTKILQRVKIYWKSSPLNGEQTKAPLEEMLLIYFQEAHLIQACLAGRGRALYAVAPMVTEQIGSAGVKI